MPHRIIWIWYTGRWWVGCYIWYSEEGTGQGRSPAQARPRCTKCNSPPINVLLYNGIIGPITWSPSTVFGSQKIEWQCDSSLGDSKSIYGERKLFQASNDKALRSISECTNIRQNSSHPIMLHAYSDLDSVGLTHRSRLAISVPLCNVVHGSGMGGLSNQIKSNQIKKWIYIARLQ